MGPGVRVRGLSSGQPLAVLCGSVRGSELPCGDGDGAAPHLPLPLSLQLSPIAELDWQNAFPEEKGLLLPR